MCGLFGILQHHASGPPAEDALKETARRLHHRGPDGFGIHADVGIGLVHTRLSLVDLNERSNQPFWDRSRRHCLIYNGELYDYGELRARLESRGVVFRTTSDTEVLLEALVHFGVEATLPQLEGMFAFALYDAHEQTLVLARDRFGIKPLFFSDGDAAFIASSTVRAMRPWMTMHPDALTVSSYLQGNLGPTSGRSFYEDVRIMPPGAVVRVKRGGKAEFRQCLTLADLIDPRLSDELATRPDAELIDQVEQALLVGVESQLQADVPVGAFCSGGVDSSLLMAMAARSHGDLRIFHADIEGPLSERSAAERLARHLHLDMKAVAVRDHHFVDSIPDITEHFGFPFAVHPTSVPLRLVSQLVHDNGIKAVLTGEGSDECFLGYRWLAPNVGETIRGLPRRAWRTLVPRRPGTGAFSQRDRDLVRGMPGGFENEVGAVEFARVDVPAGDGRTPIVSLATNAELGYVLRTLLHRNDTMGMAASIEARFPFLDSRLLRLGVNLPLATKIRFSPTALDSQHPFFRDKWIIRQVAKRYIPRELSHRPKRALPTSAAARMRVADAFFADGFVSDWFGLERRRLQHLLNSASTTLRFRLMLLEAWGHVGVRELPKADLAAKLGQHVRVEAAR